MRKLASIQKIIDIQPIENADAIEVVTVLGWKVVVKKDTFEIGDLCVYFEIDSLLPELPMFEFLRGSSWRDNLGAYRLKTVKLRKQVSQGLALPLNTFEDYIEDIYDGLEGSDLTEVLGIEKYEPPITDGEEGQSKSYNWEISRTDEIRVQSEPSVMQDIYGKPYYVSLKLDGTSSTFILSQDQDTKELDFNVCGRNVCFARENIRTNEDGTVDIEPNNNKYWEIAKAYNIEENLYNHFNKYNTRIALQGELVGSKIQSNRMGIDGRDLYIFNVLETDSNNNFIPVEVNRAIEIVEGFGMKFVPIVDMSDSFTYSTIDELLDLAKGRYCDYPEFQNADPKQQQEGVVIRTFDCSQSFKVINNDFLLKGGD